MANKKNKKTRFDYILFSLGIVLFVSALFYNSYAPKVLAFSSFPEAEFTKVIPEQHSFIPQTIVIERLGISLPIQYATIQDGVWDINDTSAMYLAESALPGETGTTVIYAHNKNNLFGPLLKISKEDIVKITSNSGEVVQYKVYDIFTVKPSDVSVLKAKNDKELTLYTCTGFLDSKRFIVKAHLEE